MIGDHRMINDQGNSCIMVDNNDSDYDNTDHDANYDDDDDDDDANHDANYDDDDDDANYDDDDDDDDNNNNADDGDDNYDDNDDDDDDADDDDGANDDDNNDDGCDTVPYNFLLYRALLYCTLPYCTMRYGAKLTVLKTLTPAKRKRPNVGEVEFIQKRATKDYFHLLNFHEKSCYYDVDTKSHNVLEAFDVDNDDKIILIILKFHSATAMWFGRALIAWRGQCRNLHAGVPGYRPPKVISTHFCRLVTNSATNFPQCAFEGKTR